jgi:hypothetical protein
MIVMMSENQLCRSQVHVTEFRCLRVKCQKVGLNRQLKAHTAGGGPGSHPTPNPMIGKRIVNTTLAKGHHADPVHCLKFTTFSHDCSTPNIHLHYYLLNREDDYSQDRFPAIHYRSLHISLYCTLPGYLVRELLLHVDNCPAKVHLAFFISPKRTSGFHYKEKKKVRHTHSWASL